MKKNLLFILVAAIFWASCAKPTYQYPAVFGERMDKRMGYERVIRIFMDKEGLYYPDIYIKDNDLRKVNGSLREWYKTNPKMMSILYKKYNIVDSASGSIDDNIERIDNAIARIYVRDINIMAQDYMTVDILIHGYRKKAYGSATDFSATSVRNNQDLEGALLFGTRKDVLFVEVYWDANFFSAWKSPDKSASLFYHNAIPSAMNVGLKLRKVVPLINKKKEINIIAHNIGARAAAELTFNASGGFLQGESIYNTPAHKNIRICLIAPAVSSSLFDNYNNRNPYAPVTGDNYELSIVYNENDLVAHKKLKLGPFTKGHLTPVDSGNTSLGANFDGDIAKLKDIIKQPNLKTFDFSTKGKKKRKCSTLNGCYVENTAKFTEVADYLGDKATYVPPPAYVPLDKRKKRPGAAPVRKVLTPEEKAKIKADKRAAEKAKEEQRREKEKERNELAKQRQEEKRLADKEKMNAARQKEEDRRIAEKERQQAANSKLDEKRQLEKQKQAAAKDKEMERRQKEREREDLAQQKAAERKQLEKDRALTARQKEEDRKLREKQKAAETRQKADDRRQAEKDKAEAARQIAKEKALAARQKEEERKDLAKQKENEKRDAARVKEAEAKQKEAEKRDAAKQKEAEKREAAKQKEAERREKERSKK